MANLSLYDPIGTRFNRMMASFPGFFAPSMMFEDAGLMELKLDITEDDKNYVVRADIPGVKKEDIKIDIDGNCVTISAETKRRIEDTREEKKGETIVRSERYEGKVYRTFTLERNVDEAKAQAKYRDGVLELTLPKTSNGTAKRVIVS
jgi:HSP20 family protein